MQPALTKAGSGDEIWVSAGTYTPGNNRSLSFILRGGVTLLGGFPVGGGELYNRDWLANQTILSGDIGTPGMNVDNSYHVVNASYCSEESVLDGFIIRDGYVESTISNNNGGGLYNDHCPMSIKNTTITNNFAEFSGGGLWANMSDVSIENVKFSYNSANSGGGLYNSMGSILYSKGVVESNTSVSGSGKDLQRCGS